MACERLNQLTAGMAIPYGGDRVARVSEALAAAFQPGDRLIVVQESGELLHVPAAVHEVATAAVNRAVDAFAAMGTMGDDAVSAFFESFAHSLEVDDGWAPIAAANAQDVASAKARGGTTVVFRIGSDALGTARAIVEHALAPALASAGLPAGACVLVERAEHAA